MRAAPREPAAVEWRESQPEMVDRRGKWLGRMVRAVKPRIMRLKRRVWPEEAKMLAATIMEMYGRKIHVVLTKPTGRQKRAPTAMEAIVMNLLCALRSSGREDTARIGIARTNPTAHETDVNSNGEMLKPLAPMVRFVKPSYLQNNNKSLFC